jgi:hypothetical protein
VLTRVGVASILRCFDDERPEKRLLTGVWVGATLSTIAIGVEAMEKSSESPSVKTIEDLIQSQMIEKEAIVRLLIKKRIITPDEFKAEVDLLRGKIQKQPK